MAGVPEGKMTVVGTAEVQFVGVGKASRVAIRATQHGVERISRPDVSRSNGDGVLCDARDDVRGTVEPEKFIDGGCDSDTAVDQLLGGIRMFGQSQGGVADGVDGGAVAGEGDVDEEHEHLIGGDGFGLGCVQDGAEDA